MCNISTRVELHSFRRWLYESPVFRIGLVLRVNLLRILQKLTCLEITGYLVKYSTVLMTSSTSKQEWSKGLEAGKKS
jgi:hypothetical protein